MQRAQGDTVNTLHQAFPGRERGKGSHERRRQKGDIRTRVEQKLHTEPLLARRGTPHGNRRHRRGRRVGVIVRASHSVDRLPCGDRRCTTGRPSATSPIYRGT